MSVHTASFFGLHFSSFSVVSSFPGGLSSLSCFPGIRAPIPGGAALCCRLVCVNGPGATGRAAAWGAGLCLSRTNAQSSHAVAAVFLPRAVHSSAFILLETSGDSVVLHVTVLGVLRDLNIWFILGLRLAGQALAVAPANLWAAEAAHSPPLVAPRCDLWRMESVASPILLATVGQRAGAQCDGAWGTRGGTGCCGQRHCGASRTG